MAILKLFKNGSSQAVRIPKEYEFSGDRVIARPYKGGLLITPAEQQWRDVFEKLDRHGASELETPEDETLEAFA